MPFSYLKPTTGRVWQGDVLANVVRYKPVRAEIDVDPDVERINHPTVVVLHAACDLEADYRIRHAAEERGRLPGAKCFHVLCCDLFSADELRIVAAGEKEDRVTSNQVSRFHHLRPGAIEDSDVQLGAFVIDFRLAIALDIELLYQDLEAGITTRLARVPPVYLQDLTQRFYNHHARVGLPA